MRDDREEEYREKDHIFVEKFLLFLLIVFCIWPMVSGWFDGSNHFVGKMTAIFYRYDTLSSPVCDVTTPSGHTFEDVKTVYTQDWTTTKWKGQKPYEGIWCTKDNRVILMKGNCFAEQITPTVTEENLP